MKISLLLELRLCKLICVCVTILRKSQKEEKLNGPKWREEGVTYVNTGGTKLENFYSQLFFNPRQHHDFSVPTTTQHLTS